MCHTESAITRKVGGVGPKLGVSRILSARKVYRTGQKMSSPKTGLGAFKTENQSKVRHKEFRGEHVRGRKLGNRKKEYEKIGRDRPTLQSEMKNRLDLQKLNHEADKLVEAYCTLSTLRGTRKGN